MNYLQQSTLQKCTHGYPDIQIFKSTEVVTLKLYHLSFSLILDFIFFVTVKNTVNDENANEFGNAG